MKKTLILCALVLMGASMDARQERAKLERQDAAQVYICTGGSSKKYHKTRTCFGLKSCKGQVKQVSVEKAEEMGKTACKICYKKK